MKEQRELERQSPSKKKGVSGSGSSPGGGGGGGGGAKGGCGGGSGSSSLLCARKSNKRKRMSSPFKKGNIKCRLDLVSFVRSDLLYIWLICHLHNFYVPWSSPIYGLTLLEG
jgi:hypothetical protein